MKAVQQLKLVRSFYGLVQDPTQTERIFEMSSSAQKIRGPLIEPAMAYIHQQPGFRELFDSTYSPRLPPLAELVKMRDGTLGREFSRYIIGNGLDVEFFPVPKTNTIENFVIDRSRRSHDFWHVLTGFGTSVDDEIGLQGFSLAQMRSPMSALLIAGGLLHALLKKPDLFSPMVDKIFLGYQMGLKARSLIGLPIETMLGRDLEELRRELQIEAINGINASLNATSTH